MRCQAKIPQIRRSEASLSLFLENSVSCWPRNPLIKRGSKIPLEPRPKTVTGGGLSPDETSWIACSDRYFLPYQILSCVFRGKFLAGLRTAFVKGQFRMRAGLDPQVATVEFKRLVSLSVRTD
jgi:Putative transposase